MTADSAAQQVRYSNLQEANRELLKQVRSSLVGCFDPVDRLWGELQNASVPIGLAPGQVSPNTRDGAEFATADFYPSIGLWQVYFPKGAHAHQLYHELLHAQLRSIRGCTVLQPAEGIDDVMRSNVAELNNDFDHALIVRDEVTEYTEAIKYWEDDFTRVFETLPKDSSIEQNLHTAKLGLLRGWLVLPVAIPDSDVTLRYRLALRDIGMEDPAEEMTRAVQAAGIDKALALSTFRDCLGLNFPPSSAVSVRPP